MPAKDLMVESAEKAGPLLRENTFQFALACFFIERDKSPTCISRSDFDQEVEKMLQEFRDEATIRKNKNEGFEEFADRDLADWKRLREMVQHEDSLINNRMTWMLSSNAFLLLTYYWIFSLRDTFTPVELGTKILVEVLLCVLCLVAMRICWHIRYTIGLAFRQIARAKQWWYMRFENSVAAYEKKDVLHRNFLEALGDELGHALSLFIVAEHPKVSRRHQSQRPEWNRHPCFVGDDIFPDYPGWLRFSIPSGFIILWAVALVVSLILLNTPDQRELTLQSTVNVMLQSNASDTAGGNMASVKLSDETLAQPPKTGILPDASERKSRDTATATRRPARTTNPGSSPIGGAETNGISGRVVAIDKTWMEIQPLNGKNRTVVPLSSIKYLEIIGPNTNKDYGILGRGSVIQAAWFLLGLGVAILLMTHKTFSFLIKVGSAVFWVSQLYVYIYIVGLVLPILAGTIPAKLLSGLIVGLLVAYALGSRKEISKAIEKMKEENSTNTIFVQRLVLVRFLRIGTVAVTLGVVALIVCAMNITTLTSTKSHEAVCDYIFVALWNVVAFLVAAVGLVSIVITAIASTSGEYQRIRR